MYCLAVPFKTDNGNHYIYDGRTNSIFSLSSTHYEIIRLYYNASKNDIIHKLMKTTRMSKVSLTHKYDQVRDLIKNLSCFYVSGRQKSLSFPERKVYENMLANASSLILEITQKCNFRCAYCTYSGRYHYYRLHSNKSMSFEVARNSVDYFVSLLTSERRTLKPEINNVISFYGGEPLIEIELIKRIVKYVNETYDRAQLNLHYAITTNCSLINEKILDFLVVNRFVISISIDGPKDVHDLNRNFANGTGTFRHVWKNIVYIKRKYPSYYDDHVRFLVTLSRTANLAHANKFFSNNKYFRQNNLQVNPVNLRYTDFVEKSHKSYAEMDRRYYSDFKKNMMKGLVSSVSPFILNNYKNIFDKCLNRPFSHVPRFEKLTAACYPGNKKIFVSSNGNFHICEKMPPYFPIGDHRVGVDYDKVKKVCADYFRQVADKCNICSARHFCLVCQATAARARYFDGKEICELSRGILKRRLSEYVSIMERNPAAFRSISFA